MNNIGKDNYNVKQYLTEIIERPIAIFEELTSWSERDYHKFDMLLKELKSPCENTVVTTKEKGDRLENLVAFLMKKTYFYDIYQNVSTGTNEIDEVITLSKQGKQALSCFNISKDLLEINTDIVLGECKNYSSTLNVTYVGKFYSLMVSTDVSFGIIFTQKGLTGNENEFHDAYGLTKVLRIIEKYRNGKDLFIITFTLEDYELIGNRTSTFFELIKSKKLELQLASNYDNFLRDYHHVSENAIKEIIQTIQ